MDMRHLTISPTARSLGFSHRAHRHQPSYREPSPLVTLASRTASTAVLAAILVFLVLLPVLLAAGMFPTGPAMESTPGPAPAFAPA